MDEAALPLLPLADADFKVMVEGVPVVGTVLDAYGIAVRGT